MTRSPLPRLAKTVHTVTVHTVTVAEADIRAAAAAAIAAGCTHWEILAPRPALWDDALGRAVASPGLSVAARGSAAAPMLTRAQAAARSGR